MNQTNQTSEDIKDTSVFIGCVNVVKYTLNKPSRLNQEDQDEFKLAMFSLIDNHNTNPSIKTLYNYADARPSHKIRQRIKGLLDYSQLAIKHYSHIKPYWVKQSNGSLIKSSRSTFEKVIIKPSN